MAFGNKRFIIHLEYSYRLCIWILFICSIHSEDKWEWRRKATALRRASSSQRNNPYDNCDYFFSFIWVARALYAHVWLLGKAARNSFVVVGRAAYVLFVFVIVFWQNYHLFDGSRKKRENTATAQFRWTFFVFCVRLWYEWIAFSPFAIIKLMMHATKWERTEYYELSERVIGEILLFGNPKLVLHHFGLNICTLAVISGAQHEQIEGCCGAMPYLRLSQWKRNAKRRHEHRVRMLFFAEMFASY